MMTRTSSPLLLTVAEAAECPRDGSLDALRRHQVGFLPAGGYPDRKAAPHPQGRSGQARRGRSTRGSVLPARALPDAWK